MKQLDHDIRAYKIYLGRVSNAEASIYHAKQDWQAKNWTTSLAAADAWMKTNVCVTLLNKGCASSLVTHWQKFKRNLKSSFGLTDDTLDTQQQK